MFAKIKSIFSVITDILFIIAAIFFIYSIFHKSPPSVITQDNSKIDSLTKIITVKLDSIRFEENRLPEISAKIDSLNSIITQNNIQTQKIDSVYNEKVNSINSYDVDQLQRYLSAYGQ